MAQISSKLNNQMQSFYTSEILELPKEIDALSQEDKFLAQEEIVKTYLNRQPKQKQTNLVYFNQDCANFPIEEIRRMQAEAEYSAGFSGNEQRVFVLFSFDSASIAAQNAALKIIEESPKNTLILLLVTKKEKLLETITSRCHEVKIENNSQSSKTDYPDFELPTSYSQAIDLAEQYKDRNQAINLIEFLLRKKLDKAAENKIKRALFQAYQDLNRNQNVQLTMENCFFSLVSLES